MTDRQPISTERNENGSHRISLFRSAFAWCGIEHRCLWVHRTTETDCSRPPCCSVRHFRYVNSSDECFSWRHNLFRTTKIRASLTTGARRSLVHSLVKSRLEYGNAILNVITDRLTLRLEMVQHSAVRVVLLVKLQHYNVCSGCR